MHRNTLLLVIVLAIVAALVVGVQIGRSINPSLSQPPQVGPSPTLAQTSPTLAPPSLLTYTNDYCGFSFSYPSTMSVTSGASGSAVLADSLAPKNPILIACQEDIPKPPLTQENIEVATIAGALNAAVYHDASPQDGSPIDALIFTNPKNGLDVFISGLGETFNQIISTVQLLP